MAIDSHILLEKVKRLKRAFDAGVNFSDALVAALNTGNALMQQRIFLDNVDIKGNSFGGYIGEKKFQTRRGRERDLFGATATTRARVEAASLLRLTPYQRKRANRGRQVIRKDLELEGELRRSIEVQIVDEREAVIEFNNLQSALVARGQENQITNIREGRKGITKGDGVKIFALNEQEIQETNRQMILLVNQLLK